MSSPNLVVVGASFAGLACARAAALRGLPTTVLERRTAADRSIQTTGILVKEVADLWDVPRRLTRKIHGVRLYSPSLHALDLARPGYHFLATDTPGLLDWWARSASDAGVEIRWGHGFSGCRPAPGGRVVIPAHDLECDFLIGADGARSTVARSLGLDLNRRLLTGLEAECAGVAGIDEDHLHVFLDSKLAPGYIAWAVPGVEAVQIGLASSRPGRLPLEALLAKLGTVFDFQHLRILGYRAGLIPVGGPLRRIASERVVLVGDAAGWVSPLTAGGIHCALAWGRLAGIAVADYLLDGAPHPATVVRRTVPSFAFKRRLRWLVDLRPPDRWLDAALGSRLLRRAAQLVFFHHRGLLGADAWREWRTARRRDAA
jgi:digeranylgeranylglycerophospholipid reductase